MTLALAHPPAPASPPPRALDLAAPEAALRALARNPLASILTRRAAEDALSALTRVQVRLAIDAGAPTHVRPFTRNVDDGNVVRVLGPDLAAPSSSSVHAPTVSPTPAAQEVPR